MQQFNLFQMTSEAQHLSFTAQAMMEKQSNLSSTFTASTCYEDNAQPLVADDEDADFGDIYDEYIDFEVCSKNW